MVLQLFSGHTTLKVCWSLPGPPALCWHGAQVNFSLPSGPPGVEEPLKPERLRRIILDSPDWNTFIALLDFPGGTAEKSPPASAGEVGVIPGPEDPTCLGATEACVPQRWSLYSSAHELPMLSPRAATTGACDPRACARRQEKPPQWGPLAPQ